MEEDASDPPLAIRKGVTATPDILPRLPSPPPGSEIAIDGLSTRSLCTEHIEYCPPDSIVVEHTSVGQTLSSDVEVPTSRSRTPVLNDFLPVGTLLPLDPAVTLSEYISFSLESHSQMLAPAASGPARSWDPSATVDGNERAKIVVCQENGKGELHDVVMVTSDIPT